nr:DUF4377 domain-containing protein [uncultured Chryseobacterium sp.]
MKNRFTYPALSCILLLSVGCHKDDENLVREAEFNIASTYEKCTPSYPSTESNHCLKITETGKNIPYYVGETTIIGFNYEPGYEYKVLIKLTKVTNPPADGSDTNYELIKVISKEEAK